MKKVILLFSIALFSSVSTVSAQDTFFTKGVYGAGVNLWFGSENQDDSDSPAQGYVESSN
ncbi:MAG: hypothetical protein JXR07_14225 [Reichenbachiella sp.]